MDAFAAWQPADKVAVEINGMLIQVPLNTTNVYLAQAHVNPASLDEISRSDPLDRSLPERPTRSQGPSMACRPRVRRP
ncbi:hypothetical protein [Nonomuraea sp. 10N515B]|uniref:hypothetical protein n=1 Tax=Nonomuraea sp. 10N515B TaxID=3457422 RepID=UPI003FCCCFCB